MIQRERRQRVLDYLLDRDVLTVEEACTLLNASPATVRRDFRALAKMGLAERTRGGVGRVQTVLGGMLPFVAREVQQSREKDAIACEAARLLRPGDVVMIDGGTSTFHLAKYLPDCPLRIITNSLRMAAALGDKRHADADVEVFLTGGYVYPQSGLLVGPQAVNTLAQYHADWAFLSVGGICEDGIFNTNELVVESERMMIRNADRTVVLADHTKIGRRSMCRLAELSLLFRLITDSYPETDATIQRLREMGLDIVSVEVPS